MHNLEQLLAVGDLRGHSRSRWSELLLLHSQAVISC